MRVAVAGRKNEHIWVLHTAGMHADVQWPVQWLV
jgi:hypothetical protein